MHEGLKDTVPQDTIAELFSVRCRRWTYNSSLLLRPRSRPRALGPFFLHVETLHPLTHGACCPALVLPVRHADDVCSGGKADMTTPGNNFRF